MTVAGLVAWPDRAALAGTLAPVTGAAARAMERATAGPGPRGQADQLGAGGGVDPATRLFADAGRRAVQDAIASYRRRRPVTGRPVAWLSVAWPTCRSGMTPGPGWPRNRDATSGCGPMWSAGPVAYLAAPAWLLAFTAWQSGEGALANIAIDRALAADPRLLAGPPAAGHPRCGRAAVRGAAADDAGAGGGQLRGDAGRPRAAASVPGRPTPTRPRRAGGKRRAAGRHAED